MKAGRIALITTGTLAALLAAALLAGAAWVANADTDFAGYVVSGEHRVQTVSHAFVSHDLDVDSDFDWVLDRGPKLRVSGESEQPLFIGIARTPDVERYLAGTEYDEVTDFDIDPFALSAERHPGAYEPSPPTGQTFWVASTHGDGPQTLDWDAEHGEWSIVVMNADGSRGVDAALTLGAHIPHLTWIGVGAGVAGAGFVALAVGLFYLGARPSRRDRLAPSPAAPSA